jgi:hypothetical protein
MEIAVCLWKLYDQATRRIEGPGIVTYKFNAIDFTAVSIKREHRSLVQEGETKVIRLAIRLEKAILFQKMLYLCYQQLLKRESL